MRHINFTMDAYINIPLSKKKLLWIITGSIAFILLGGFLFAKAKAYETNEVKILFLQITGIASVLFFSLTLFYAVKKINDKKWGLSITKEGIVDNSSGISLGLIKWSDITGFKELNYQGTKNLVILVQNPETYLERAKGPLQRRLVNANFKLFGSPVAIAANALTIKYEQLKEHILQSYNHFNSPVK